ncbi:hypothetical protein D9758_018712 [Tetrapyrgos nigripes]|uniref:Uncharacterized protein n=1 Tax=Tetrapyrgos nigripes TaxID=182062 RepID=A0A8H5B1I7_9AGAR|nr:hypothetical protein D9758_018712 [Tetrapyrgos nigripes]
MQWRIPFIMQMVPGVFFVILMIFQPETPRWLVEHKREDEAARVLAYVARTSPSDPAVQATIDEIKAEFPREAGVASLATIHGNGRELDHCA